MMNEDQSRYADEGTLAYIAKLEQQLAASQAENLRLREVLKMSWSAMYVDGAKWRAISEELLSTQPGDQSALREVIARVLDEWAGDNDLGLDEACEKLRSGEWTPETLK